MEHTLQVNILKELMQQLDEGKNIDAVIADIKISIEHFEVLYINEHRFMKQNMTFGKYANSTYEQIYALLIIFLMRFIYPKLHDQP